MKRTLQHLLLGAAVLVLATCDDPSDSSDPSTAGPPPPTSVTALPGPHANEITVRWASKVGPSYTVYGSTSPNVAPGNGTTIPVEPYQGPHGVRAVHSGVASNTTYYYAVTAYAGTAGEGPPSSVISAKASGDMGLSVAIPEPGQFVSSLLSLVVGVDSRFTVQSVVATVGGQFVNLTYSAGAWRGTIPLDAVPPGPVTGTVAATDVYSTMITGSFAFVHGSDGPLTLTIASPESLTVARPNVRLNVSCVDYDLKGCYDVAAYEISTCINTKLAQDPSGFDKTVSLAQCDGGYALLQFNASDSTWHTTIKRRRVFVELSPNLTEVASVHGSILDVQPDRILVLTQTDSVSTGVSIQSRVSGSAVVVYNTPGHAVTTGFLTPMGAMFLERTGSAGPTVLHEWQSGTLSDLGNATGLAVKGNYAAFTTGAGLIRRDVTTGTNTTVSAATGAFDVAANGDVVWQASDEVWRFRDGVTTQLTNDGSTFVDVSPKTDGINVAYLKVNGGFTTAVFDATGEHILTPVPLNNGSQPYRVANGWVAYTKSVSGAYQVWSRSPAGEERHVVAFVAGGEVLDALGPNGEVTLFRTRRYLAVPDYNTAPREINSTLGTGLFQSGSLFITIGRSLFQVNP